MKASEELKYLINDFYINYPDDVEEFEKGYRKNQRFLVIIGFLCATIMFLVAYLCHVSGPTVEANNPELETDILVWFFSIFGALGYFSTFSILLFRGVDSEGRWFLNEIKGSCRMSKINETFFIPNKKHTHKNERNPIPWKEVKSISHKITYVSGDNEGPGTFHHYLQMFLKNSFETKLVWIIFTTSGRENHYLAVLMKKFCEYLIEKNQ